jgi:hypothetical protein
VERTDVERIGNFKGGDPYDRLVNAGLPGLPLDRIGSS